MRFVATSLVVLGLALVSGRLVLADDDERHDDDAAGWGAPVEDVVRPQHDVACSLRVKTKRGAALAGTRVRATLVVANRTRRRVQDVALAVYADSTSSAPLWSQTIGLRGHRRAVRHLRLDVPAGATTLVAVATCAQDDNPGNNMDTVIVGTGPVGGDDGGTTGGTIGTHSPSAVAGAATYSANCASCHGAAAQGTRLGPRILGRSAGDVYEAVREGDDGMPRFLGITTTDAKNIAAFLADPSAATSTSPPPAGPATYAGSVQAMLASNCVACHQGSSAPYGVRLDTYADAVANASSALAAMKGQAVIPGTSTIDPTAMPPGSNPSSPTAATTANIELLTTWIAAGTPQ